ncbi:MAG TPA: hypothetical protein VI007_02795 [bacterium]
MSVRAIAIRSAARPVVRAAPLPAHRRRTPGAVSWAAMADDRRLIGVKLILIGLLFAAVMALEVPW